MSRITLPTTQIDDADETVRSQLDLFELMDPDPRRRNPFSNTLDLYDALPKYNFDQKEIENVQDAQAVRAVKVSGQEYTVKITPAVIKRGSRNVMIFPGAREELVEKALRKFVVDGQGKVQGGEVGVSFTLYQLYNELASHGRTYSYTEISEAIDVCQGSRIEVATHDGQSVVKSQLFPTVALTSRREYIENPADAKCFVKFNPLITDSIINLTFRQYNYQVGMSISSQLARYMHERMSHYWIQASANNPYTITLISYLEQSGRGLSKLMSDNIRAMTRALDTLIEHEIVSHYEQDRTKDGRKIVDVYYTIYPHEKFVKQMIANNQRHNQVKIQAIRKNLRGNTRRIGKK